MPALGSRSTSTDDFGRPAVGDVHDVRVRLQGQGRRRVPEPAGHGADVDAAGQHHRGGEMAEMMEPDVGEPEVVARAMNREVTPPGRSGDVQSGDEDHSCASTSSEMPRAAQRSAARSRRSPSTDSVAESRAILRMWPVLVERISIRPGRSETDRRTSSTRHPSQNPRLTIQGHRARYGGTQWSLRGRAKSPARDPSPQRARSGA